MRDLLIFVLIAALLSPSILVVNYIQKQLHRRILDALSGTLRQPSGTWSKTWKQLMDKGYRMNWKEMGMLVATATPVFLLGFTGLLIAGLAAVLGVGAIIGGGLFVRNRLGRLNAEKQAEVLEEWLEEVTASESPLIVDDVLNVLKQDFEYLIPDIDQSLLAWGSPTAHRLLNSYKPSSLKANKLRALNIDEAMGLLVDEQHPASLYRSLTMRESLSFWRSIYNKMEAGELNAFQLEKRFHQPEIRAHLEVIQRQVQAHRFHPEVFCTRCNERGEVREKEGFEVVVCPVCQDQDAFELGVHEVVGIVGKEGIGKRVGSSYELSIWDEQQRKATPVQLDGLRIEPHDNLNFDWAVAATVEMIRNQGNWKAGKKIPITVHPDVTLSPNTWTLLNELSGSEESNPARQ